MTLKKLHIFRFALIEMFGPCFLNTCVMSFLVRSDCGPLVYLRRTSPTLPDLWYHLSHARVLKLEN